MGLIGKTQLVDVFHEVYYTYDGSIVNYPTDYSTYRIYARLQDPTDFLKAVYAGAGENYGSTSHLFLGGCTIMNVSFGGVAGSDINEAFFQIFPITEYDSYITIGSGNYGDLNHLFPPVEAQNQMFGASNYVELDTPFPLGELSGGSYEIMDSNPDGYGIAPDNRVLLAQITCKTNTLSYALNIMIYNNGDPSEKLYYCNTLDGPPGQFDGIPEIDASELGLVHGGVSCNDPQACNYQPDATCNTFCIFSSPGDLNCDGVVSTNDLLDFFTEYGCQSDCGPADINGDGVVSISDLILLIGSCC